MGLSGKDRELINESLDTLKRMTEELEDARADFRAIDAIDIAMSLLEQQLEEDVEYIIARDERPGHEDDNMVHAHIDNEESEADVEIIEPASLDNLDFKFLDPTAEYIPSPDELESWFAIDYPEEDNL